MFDVPGATINQIKYVKLTFIDGSVFKITPFEFRKLNDVTFMLRPVENDS